MPHPPDSPDPPDLALSNFFLFPQKKQVLKGKCLADVEEVKQKTKKH